MSKIPGTFQGVLSLIVHAGTDISERDFTLASRCFARAMELLTSSPLQNVMVRELPQSESIEALLWVFRPAGIVANTRAWMDMVGRMTPQQREAAFSNAYAPMGCIDFCDQLWLRAAESPNPDWPSILTLLCEVATFAREHDIELLWACAVRAQLLVISRVSNEIDRAEKLALEAIGIASDEPWVRFLIADSIGRELSVAGRHEAALTWLEQAIAIEADELALFRMETFIFASRSIGDRDPATAIEYARKGVTLARSTPDTPGRFMVRALAELALALWLADDRVAAFDPLDEAAELLFACREDTTDWRSLFAFFGHVAGYFASMVTTGGPPVSSPDGQPHILPPRGTFLRSNGARAAFYRAENECAIPGQLAMFASAVGKINRAASWSLKGIDLARASGQTWALAVLGWGAVADQLAGDRYGEALDVALDAGPAIVAGRIWQQQGKHPLDPGFEPLTVLGPKPGEAWSEAEACTAMMCLVPATLRIATVSFEDRERSCELAMELAALCRQVGLQSSSPLLWTGAADLLEKVFVHPVSGQSLLRACSGFSDENVMALLALAQIGASLQPDISPADALRGHLVVIPYLFRRFEHARGIEERILLPFISTFWSMTFQRSRFRFSVPGVVERDLEQALGRIGQAPARTVAIAILQAVALGLGVSLPDNFRE